MLSRVKFGVNSKFIIQCEPKNPPLKFFDIYGYKFLVQILYAIIRPYLRWTTKLFLFNELQIDEVMAY